MKRPTTKAVQAALYALFAAREVLPGPGTHKEANDIAARVLLLAMNIPIGEQAMKEARVELVRACMMTGMIWFGDREER